MLVARASLAAVFFQGKLYAIGGELTSEEAGSGAMITASVEVVDPNAPKV